MFNCQHPGGENFRRIARKNRDARLTEQRSGVKLLGDLMNRTSRIFIACGKGSGMGVQAGIFGQK